MSEQIINQDMDDFRKHFNKEIKYILTLEDLDPSEKKLLQKYVDNEKLTEKEEEDFYKILDEFRKAKAKIKPEETFENQINSNNLIQTERELLEFIEDLEKPKEIKVNFYGKILTFLILPITDANVIIDVQKHLSLYASFDENEEKILKKGATNQRLNKRELKIYKKLQKDLEDNEKTDYEQMIEIFLSNQLRLKGDAEGNLEVRKLIFQKMPALEKTALFLRVEEELQINEFNDKDFFL